MLPQDTDADLLAFCVATAQQAGELIRAARAEGDFTHRYKHGVELVSSADEASDRFIRAEIERRYPGHAILSEEGEEAPSPDLTDGPLWVIDPIDGTVNFVHGQDCVAVAIAYAERGVVQIGVVCAPFRGETFSAIRGRGAWRNDVPIYVSDTTRLRDALIGTGFPHDRSDLSTLLPRLARVLRQCQDVRRLGSPALDICFVADGRLDGFYEGALAPWDVGAAGLIAREAGALWGHVDAVPAGTPPDLYGRDMLVTAPAIFDSLAALLRRED